MKKKYIVFVLLFVVLGCFIFCYLVNNKNDDLYLKQLHENNSINKLLKSKNSISTNGQFYNKNGDVEFSDYHYADKDIVVVEDSNRNVTIVSDSDVYGFNGNDVNSFRTLFVGNKNFKDYRDEVRKGYFVDIPNNGKFSSKKEKGNNLILRYTFNSEVVQGYRDDEIFKDTKKVIYEYVVDKNSFIINEWNVYVIISNKEIKYENVKFTYDVDEYEVSQEIVDDAFGEGRVVTIITDPDTKDEKKYEQTVSKGCAVVLNFDEEYENIYTDKKCTKLKKKKSDLDSDSTFYMMKGK